MTLGFFLSVIYTTYIMYGIPYNAIGSVWVDMATELNINIANIGVISSATYISFIISNTLAPVFMRKIGTGKTLSLSTFCYAIAMFLILFAKNTYFLIFANIFIGFGNGLIDTTANYFVMTNFKSRNTAWLHACWGTGSFIGAFILSRTVYEPWNYKIGVRILLVLFLLVSIFVFMVRVLWQRKKDREHFVDPTSTLNKEGVITSISNYRQVVFIKNVWIFFIIHLLYQVLQHTTSTWISTYCITFKGFSKGDGATIASILLIGILTGRFLVGFLTEKIDNKNIILGCMLMVVVGIVMILLSPINNFMYMTVAMIITGWGLAPIIPLLFHMVSRFFPNSQLPYVLSFNQIVGNIGTTISSMMMTVVASNYTIKHLFMIMIGVNVVMFVMFVILCVRNKIVVTN